MDKRFALSFAIALMVMTSIILWPTQYMYRAGDRIPAYLISVTPNDAIDIRFGVDVVVKWHPFKMEQVTAVNCSGFVVDIVIKSHRTAKIDGNGTIFLHGEDCDYPIFKISE